MNTYSKNLLENFLSQIPSIEFASLDIPSNDEVKADYRVKHTKFGDCILELKEHQDSQDFRDQSQLTLQIEKAFKGIFPKISFDCLLGGSEGSRDRVSVRKYLPFFKKFLKGIANRVSPPCRIVFPKDSIFRPFEFIQIEVLDENGGHIRDEFSPNTVSRKVPIGKSHFDSHGGFSNSCRVKFNDSDFVTIEESAIFSHQTNEYFLELYSDDKLPGGYILGPTCCGWSTDADRIRDNISKARKQLKVYESEDCPKGIIICPSPSSHANFTDLREALYGDLAVTFSVRPDGQKVIDDAKEIHSGGRIFQPKINTSISFVGLLSQEDGSVKLKIIHNGFAKFELSFEHFSDPRVLQFLQKFSKKHDGIYSHETEVFSSQQLESIRSENAPIIHLLNYPPLKTD